jgi:tetratricopeptide (TPR) repeat protein
LGGGLFYLLKKSYDPGKMLFKVAFTILFVFACLWFAHLLGPFGPFVIVFMAVVLSFMWTPHLAELVSKPISSALDGGDEPPEPKPMYSVALSKRKFNHPNEAIIAIREQLARFPNDFEGVMLLANIQAEDMNDLPGAELTLNHFCAAPGAPPRQVVAALTQLADWHMKKVADIDSARAALQQIIERFPDSEFSLRAEQRLAHLGETGNIVLAAHDRQAVPVPEGVQNLGLLDSSAFLVPAEVPPAERAAACVKHLEQHPHDTEAREKLALIYGKEFQRLDLATLELAQLINEPRHAPKQIAHWLNVLANLQVELGADEATVRATLEQIVERFPKLPIAEVTLRRLARLKSEFKGKEQASDVKLGVYEQNIGLKYGPPRRY